MLNRSRRQHPTKLLCGHLPPVTKTTQIRRTRHAGHCRRSRYELKSDVLLWTPLHSRAKAGQPARTYIEQLCEDAGCRPEALPEAMNDRKKWRERVRDILTDGTTMLDLYLQTKKQWEISNEDLEKPTKNRSPFLSNPNFIGLFFILKRPDHLFFLSGWQTPFDPCIEMYQFLTSYIFYVMANKFLNPNEGDK